MIRATRARTTAAALAGEVAVLCEGIPTRYRCRASKRAREEEDEERVVKRETPVTEDLTAYEDPQLWLEWGHADDDENNDEDEFFDLTTSEEEEEEKEEEESRVETWDLTINLAASPAEILREAQIEWLQTTRCKCQDCVRDTNGRGRNVIEYERDVLKLRLSRHRDIWMWVCSIPSNLLVDFPSISEIVLM